MQSAAKLFSALDRLIELDEVESAKQRERVEFLSLMDGVIEALPDALIVVGLDGNIVFFNHRAELMFGYPRTQMIGRPVETLLPERCRAGHVRARELYGQFAVNQRALTMGVGMDLIGLGSDGKEFATEITLSRMVTPKSVLLLASVRGAPRSMNLTVIMGGAGDPDQAMAGSDAGL